MNWQLDLDSLGNAAVFTVGVFLLAFFESLVAIGIIIPGVALLFMAAAAAAQEGISFTLLACAGALGAFLGDFASYQLGVAAQKRWHHYPWLKRYQPFMDRSKQFCDRYGALSLLIGRFVGPLRPFVPFSAGLLGFSLIQFIALALLGACLWAPAYLAPGYFIGQIPMFKPLALTFFIIMLLAPACFAALGNAAKRIRWMLLIAFFCLTALEIFTVFELNAQFLNQVVQDALKTIHLEIQQLEIPQLKIQHFYLLFHQGLMWAAAPAVTISTLVIFFSVSPQTRWRSQGLWLGAAIVSPFFLGWLIDIQATVMQSLGPNPTILSIYFALLLSLLVTWHLGKKRALIEAVLFFWVSIVMMSFLLIHQNLSHLLLTFVLAFCVWGFFPAPKLDAEKALSKAIP